MFSNTGLAAFRKFVAGYRHLISWAVAGSAGSAIPMAAALSPFTPAWPNGIIQVTAVAQLLVLALVFQLFKSRSRKVITRVMVLSTAIICVLLPIYLLLVTHFVYTEPLSKHALPEATNVLTMQS